MADEALRKFLALQKFRAILEAQRNTDFTNVPSTSDPEPSSSSSQSDLSFNLLLSSLKSGQRSSGFRRRYDHSPESKLRSLSKPQFRIRENRQYIDIMNIFEPPALKLRQKGIAILIRGAQGCGKSDVASLIIEKEKSLGNNRVSHLSLNDLHQNERDWFMVSRHEEMLVRKFKEQLREENFCFYVIELDGGSLQVFRKFYHVAVSFGQLHVYLIECLQSDEVVARNARNTRELSEVMDTNKRIINEPPPENVLLLDATKIYDRDLLSERVNVIMQRNIIKSDYSTAAHKLDEPEIDFAPNPFADLKFPNDERNFKDQVEELLKDPTFVKLIQSSFLNLSIDPKTFEPEKKLDHKFLRRARRLHVRRVIEYNHKPKPDPNELVLEFHPSKVFDYGHRTTENLFKIRCEIDIEEVLEQKKAKRIERKKNYFTELVANNEETESNPSYPSKWEVSSSKKPKLVS